MQWKSDMDKLRARVEKDKRGWKRDVREAREKEERWRDMVEKGVGEVKRLKKRLDRAERDAREMEDER